MLNCNDSTQFVPFFFLVAVMRVRATCCQCVQVLHAITLESSSAQLISGNTAALLNEMSWSVFHFDFFSVAGFETIEIQSHLAAHMLWPRLHWYKHTLMIKIPSSPCIIYLWHSIADPTWLQSYRFIISARCGRSTSLRIFREISSISSSNNELESQLIRKSCS